MRMRIVVPSPFVCAASLLCSALAAFGTTYPVDTVESLASALRRAGPDDEVIIAKGFYRLPAEACSTNQPGGVGLSHFYVNTRLVGAGETREETVLAGTGEFRIFSVSQDGRVENLTISNGYARAYGDYPNSQRGGGVYGSGRMVNCAILDCHAQTYAGGAGGGMTLERCLVRGCSAESGGGMHSGAAYHTTFCANSAISTSIGNGGGIFSVLAVHCNVLSNSCAKNGGGGYQIAVASNCLFSANNAGESGGGVYNLSLDVGRLVNCDIIGNAAAKGGGLYQVEACGGLVCDNYSTSHGGGVYSSLCRAVTNRNNICGEKATGNNSYMSDFYDCSIEGTDVSWGSATRCVFSGIGRQVSLKDNPYSQASVACTRVWIYFPNATNCLFRDNCVSAYLFQGGGAAKLTSTLVNCTVVSNVCATVIGGFKDANFPFVAVNSVFFGNSLANGTKRDLSILADTLVSFSSVAFAVSPLSTSSYPKGALLKFGEDGFGADPKFAGGDSHPYALRAASPLRGAGVWSAWMAGASDIRSQARWARANGESVDIGCYQYWRDATTMIVR